MSICVALQVKQDKKNPNQKQLFYTSWRACPLFAHIFNKPWKRPRQFPGMEWSITSRVICDHHNILGTTDRRHSKNEALLLHVRDVAFHTQDYFFSIWLDSLGAEETVINNYDEKQHQSCLTTCTDKSCTLMAIIYIHLSGLGTFLLVCVSVGVFHWKYY